ncbi:hypothetical protein Bbelb_118180 [Branchiostoma belcheri]|nr:hypothetical protein Bbelb_118180 [Branchiostoma belcheri]
MALRRSKCVPLPHSLTQAPLATLPFRINQFLEVLVHLRQCGLTEGQQQQNPKLAGLKRSTNLGSLYHSQGLGLTSGEQIDLQQHATVIASATAVSSNTETVLNSCPVALKDTRYTWRYNSVLKELVTTLRQWYSESGQQVTIRSDLSLDAVDAFHLTFYPRHIPQT